MKYLNEILVKAEEIKEPAVRAQALSQALSGMPCAELLAAAKAAVDEMDDPVGEIRMLAQLSVQATRFEAQENG